MASEKTEQLYRLIFVNMKEGLAIVRVNDKEPDAAPLIVEMNPAARRLCLGTSCQPGNCTLSDCFPGWFNGAGFPESCGRLATFGGSLEFPEVARDGCYYRIRIFDLADNHLGVVISDCTQHRRKDNEISELAERVEKNTAGMEERVAERTAQLKEINEELNGFAFSVSHDLRAPVRAMQAFAQILLEDEEHSEAEKKAYLERIRSAAQGMDRLIQDLLAYSRLSRQEITLQYVNLEKVVHEAAQQLELTSGGRTYDMEVVGELPEVLGHHTVLVQVVLNLLSNAVKFVPKGVTPRLRIWTEASEGWVRLYIEDNGIGIPPQHQERIFKIFERLHSMETYPGTGIGLAIVRKAVTRLGGHIGVESKEGEGSRFWIDLKQGERLEES